MLKWSLIIENCTVEYIARIIDSKPSLNPSPLQRMKANFKEEKGNRKIGDIGLWLHKELGTELKTELEGLVRNCLNIKKLAQCTPENVTTSQWCPFFLKSLWAHHILLELLITSREKRKLNDCASVYTMVFWGRPLPYSQEVIFASPPWSTRLD